MIEISYEIAQLLLGWFEAKKRDLPWRRRGYSPYEVWISEVMLQQTQVKTMLPFYSRWMERFPDPASIAAAPEDEVLRRWEGLGYYARAKNIRKAARVIVEEFGGKLPRDFDSVRKLPGVGPYTAGAIMSFAYNADYPAVDANVERILSRLFDISSPAGTPDFKDSVHRLASGILPSGRARDFNQAMMDLGSMICLPREPSCADCPIEGCCGAHRAGVAPDRPVKGGKKAVSSVVRAAGILIRGGKVFVRKRPESGLMPSLWEFPGGDAVGAETPEHALRRIWMEDFGMRLTALQQVAVIKHSHTSFRVTLHAFLCGMDGPAADPAENGSKMRWAIPGELEDLAFPVAHRKIVRVLLQKLNGPSADSSPFFSRGNWP